MRFVDSDEAWWFVESVVFFLGFLGVAFLCKFVENDEGNLVQKTCIWLVMIEKSLEG